LRENLSLYITSQSLRSTQPGHPSVCRCNERKGRVFI